MKTGRSRLKLAVDPDRFVEMSKPGRKTWKVRTTEERAQAIWLVDPEAVTGAALGVAMTPGMRRLYDDSRRFGMHLHGRD